MGLSKDYATALYEWLSQFAPTFRSPILSSMFNDENPQPTKYIEYSADLANFNTEFTQAITIYTKSTGYTYLMEIVDEIESAIKENGIRIVKDWGYITIRKGNVFYQDKPDEDDTIRAGYINLLVRVYQFRV